MGALFQKKAYKHVSKHFPTKTTQQTKNHITRSHPNHFLDFRGGFSRGNVRYPARRTRRRVNVKDRGRRSIGRKYPILQTDNFISKNDLGVT